MIDSNLELARESEESNDNDATTWIHSSAQYRVGTGRHQVKQRGVLIYHPWLLADSGCSHHRHSGPDGQRVNIFVRVLDATPTIKTLIGLAAHTMKIQVRVFDLVTFHNGTATIIESLTHQNAYAITHICYLTMNIMLFDNEWHDANTANDCAATPLYVILPASSAATTRTVLRNIFCSVILHQCRLAAHPATQDALPGYFHYISSKYHCLR
jgi:hypothetical protein